jgi:dipeptidyl aminopeptidase/acylaminoacyl peptidase
MTIQDLLTAVRVSNPQLSPDGRQVAFVRTTTDLASDKRNADIWVAPADGSAPPRLLIGGEKSENTPRWDEGHWVLKPLNSKLWHETVFSWMNRCLGK